MTEQAKVPLWRDPETGAAHGPMVEVRDGGQRHTRGERVRRVRDGRGAAWAQRKPADPAVTPSAWDEAWDDQSGSRWTPDLVHCRIVEACTILKRLPSVKGPRGHVSMLGMMSLDPPDRLTAPPSKAEIDLCEWTTDRIGELPITNRFIVFGFGLGLSARRIESEIDRVARVVSGVIALRKTQISDRYTFVLKELAIRWNRIGQKVDRGSYDRWVAWIEASKISADRPDS